MGSPDKGVSAQRAIALLQVGRLSGEMGFKEIRDYIRRQKPQDLLVLEEVPTNSW